MSDSSNISYHVAVSPFNNSDNMLEIEMSIFLFSIKNNIQMKTFISLLTQKRLVTRKTNDMYLYHHILFEAKIFMFKIKNHFQQQGKLNRYKLCITLVYVNCYNKHYFPLYI